jgi:hypothetical protein
MKIGTMVADMIDGMTDQEARLSAVQGIGIVMTVGSTTTPAEMNVSNAEFLKVEVVEVEEAGGDLDHGLPLADGAAPGPRPADTVAATITLTTAEITGTVPSVISVTSLDDSSA